MLSLPKVIPDFLESGAAQKDSAEHKAAVQRRWGHQLHAFLAPKETGGAMRSSEEYSGALKQAKEDSGVPRKGLDALGPCWISFCITSGALHSSFSVAGWGGVYENQRRQLRAGGLAGEQS